MNKEFRIKTQSTIQTVYVLESASSGGTSSGSIASVALPMGSVQSRKLKDSKDTDTIDHDDDEWQAKVKRVGVKAKQGPMKTVWVPAEYGTGGKYRVEPVNSTTKKKSQGISENMDMQDSNPADSVSMDVPLLIRMFEYAREDAKTDMDLHKVTEQLIALSSGGKTLSMDDYDTIVGSGESGVRDGNGRDPETGDNINVDKTDQYINSLSTMLESELTEKFRKNSPVEYYIKDFEKSNAPQFKGKTKEKRKEMALAAFRDRNIRNKK